MSTIQGHSGGCQCGAVRYRVKQLGRASICHCRMCQKAFGGFFGPLVTAKELEWTRGKRAQFKSSDLNWRGFCRDCGTPLTYEYSGGIEISIGSLDDPSVAQPTAQTNFSRRQAFFGGLMDLPQLSKQEIASHEAYNCKVRTRQHPDHDTENWPLEQTHD